MLRPREKQVQWEVFFWWVNNKISKSPHFPGFVSFMACWLKLFQTKMFFACVFIEWKFSNYIQLGFKEIIPFIMGYIKSKKYGDIAALNIYIDIKQHISCLRNCSW